MLGNRNNKPSSISKRKIELAEISTVLLKCNGIMSALTIKNNRIQTQVNALSTLKTPQALEIIQQEEQQSFEEKPNFCEQQELDAQQCSNDQVETQEEVDLTMKKKKPYRRRIDKRSSISRQKLDKFKILNNSRILVYFRNQVVSLFSILGKRDEFINSLRGNKLSIISSALKISQIQDRLQKELMAKGKDKPRKNFNSLTNQQLRSMKYKPKPLPPLKKECKSKQGYDEETEEQKQIREEDEEDDCPDMNTWKKRNGVGFNQKVFIVKGGYRQLRETLVSKGWAENEDVKSKFFDLKWTTKICDIDYSILRNGQIVNHFNNNHHLTSKYGITRRLRSLPIVYNIDIDRFYPRCFDLGDQNQFQNFVENFKFSYVEGEAKAIVNQEKASTELKIRIILKALKKLNLSLPEKITKINSAQFPVISPSEWSILNDTNQIGEEMKAEKLDIQRSKDPLYNSEKRSQTEGQILHQLRLQIQKQLQKFSKTDPQSCLNGPKNVWIAKPNFLSRGRGIKCFNNLFEIADYCLGRDVQFVIQKYIERPLLINGRKFDIRQWVCIQDYCPPRIYFYNECYLRFCMDDYSLDNIQNRFMHLTNNSVQKYNKKAKIDESMWEMSQFASYVGEENWAKIQKKIKNIVVWSIKSCENYVTSKKGSLELVGFDFMIDENLNPWLIEINMSPSMDSSTPVTKKLVKMLLHDTGLLISTSKPKKEIGNYTCILEEESDLSQYGQYINIQ